MTLKHNFGGASNSFASDGKMGSTFLDGLPFVSEYMVTIRYLWVHAYIRNYVDK